MVAGTASKLSAAVAGLRVLSLPLEEGELIERHYLTPIERMAVAAEALAPTAPRRFSDAIAAMEGALPKFSDADHRFIVERDLPQWWQPRTAAWEPRAR
jgi:hypothetical protein